MKILYLDIFVNNIIVDVQPDKKSLSQRNCKRWKL